MSVTPDGDAPGPVPHRVRRTPRGPRAGRGTSPAGAACALTGLFPLAAGVFPRFPADRTHAAAGALPGALGPFPAALSLTAGVLLLLLAPGLGRRERRAWRAAVVLLPAGAAVQYASRPSLLGTLLPLALLALLLRHRGGFTALPGPRSRWRALAHFALMGAGSIALGLVVVGAHPRRTLGSPGLSDRLEHVLYGLLGAEGPVRYEDGVSWTVGCSLGALGLLTALTTVHLAFRPGHPAAPSGADDAERLRALLERHGGRDPLGRSALRRGQGVVFSPSGRAAVRYRVVSGVMLADGDPIGDTDAWPGAIERFMDEAGARSWIPAVTGCSAAGGAVWARETGLVPRAPRPADPAAPRRRRAFPPRRTRGLPADGTARGADGAGRGTGATAGGIRP